jgi:diguanylate cyclase (GGDEF)-like protein
MLGMMPTDSSELLAAIHEDDRGRVEQQLLDAIAAGVSTSADLRLVTGSETRFMEARATLSRKGEKIRLRIVLVDVSARRNIELEMAHRASHDALTDLPNRLYFREKVNAATDPATATSRPHAVLMLDLDSFKDINDGLGHHHGDLLLVEIARRLQLAVRPADTVARLGGDEFAIWLEDCEQDRALEISERIRLTVLEPFEAEGITIMPDVSIGVARFPADAETSADLLRLADLAMYRAKRSGIGYALYDQEADAAGSDRFVLQSEIRNAIASGELEAFYQPLVDGPSGEIISCEALVRWRHPARGLLAPVDFLPMVQSSGLSPRLARFMVQSVFERLRAMAAEGIVVPIAVNLSAGDLLDPSVLACIAAEIERSDLPPGLLNVELTEAELVNPTEAMRTALFSLRDMGVRTAVDDFGTGFSSLSWLRDLPIDTLKIDRSFVVSLCADERTRAIVKSTIDLAHDLNLATVAEGVEDIDFSSATASAVGTSPTSTDRRQGATRLDAEVFGHRCFFGGLF